AGNRVQGDPRHSLRRHALSPRYRRTRRKEDMSGTNKGNAIDVAIMMGSKSDLETMRPAAKILEALGLTVEVRVLSAHRTPEHAAAFVKQAVQDGCKAFICGAGGAAGDRRADRVGRAQRLRFAAVDGDDAARHAGGDGRGGRRGERRPAGGTDHRG